MTKEPMIPPLLQEIDYSQKHQSYLKFIKGLVQTVDTENLDSFLQDAVQGRYLVSQFQRAWNKITYPKELISLNMENPFKTSEELKSYLHGVITDWESFINLLYGLKLIKEGKEKAWDDICSARLWNKVNNILCDELLQPLANIEWVTIRNALAHGTAFFDPNNNTICFKDRKRQVFWELEKSRIEGLNIFVSNIVIMQTWNFVNAEKASNFIHVIKTLRKLANNFTEEQDKVTP